MKEVIMEVGLKKTMCLNNLVVFFSLLLDYEYILLYHMFSYIVLMLLIFA